MPVTIGSGTIGSASVTGNPPAPSPGRFQKQVRLHWRILDPVSGAVLIDPLPHPHQSDYEMIAPQPGMAGMSTIGVFTIPLFPPSSMEYLWAKTDYDKLKHLARCEAYMVDDDLQGPSGDPGFSGVITELPRSLDAFHIRGLDSLHLLQTKRTGLTEAFSGSTDALAKYALKAYGLTYGDGDTAASPWTLANYNNDGGWATVTDDGYPSVQASSSGDGQLLTNSSFSNAQYADCRVIANYHLICAGGASTQANAGVVAAATDTNNLILGECSLQYVSRTAYYMIMRIFLKSGGTYTTKAQYTITIPSNQLRCQLILTGVQTSATAYTWRLTVNGIDQNITYVQPVSSGSPTGSIGIRSLKTGTLAGEQAYCSKLWFESKSNVFQAGRFDVGKQSVSQTFSGVTLLDLLNTAAGTEGFWFRKNPKAGLNNDTIDFVKTTGNDLSASVKFEEGKNLVENSLEPNAEPLNTRILMSGVPSADGFGVIHDLHIQNTNLYGLVDDIAPALQAADQLALRRQATVILANRSNPLQAKRITVVRDPDHAEFGSGTPTGLAYREGDWVTLHVPREGVYNQRVQLYTVKVVEGLQTLETTADQYGRRLDRDPIADRLIQSVKSLTVRADQNSALNATSGYALDPVPRLPINAWKMRATMSATQSVTQAVNIVHFDTVTSPGFDTSNGFSTTNFNFTVPVSGYWLCMATLDLVLPVGLTAGSQVQLLLEIFVNGTVNSIGPVASELVSTSGPFFLNFDAIVTHSLYLNAGDVVDIRADTSACGGTCTVQNAASRTSWAMDLISG